MLKIVHPVALRKVIEDAVASINGVIATLNTMTVVEDVKEAPKPRKRVAKAAPKKTGKKRGRPAGSKNRPKDIQLPMFPDKEDMEA